MKRNRVIFFLGTLLCLSGSFAQSLLPQIHSHNDYTREIPFYEAILSNAKSIEADLILKDNELYVAHEVASIVPERTFSKMYLEPILQAKNLQYSMPKDYFLSLDIKTAALPTLEKLLEQLKNYNTLLFDIKSNPEGLKLVISGNRPAAEDYTSYPDFILFDHQSIEDISQVPLHKVALFSFPFYRYSNWRGEGEIPTEATAKLRGLIDQIHDLNKPIRFWATADNADTWDYLIDMGVDFINTDQPTMLWKYLNSKASALQSD